jgi:hypothetical protein
MRECISSEAELMELLPLVNYFLLHGGLKMAKKKKDAKKKTTKKKTAKKKK